MTNLHVAEYERVCNTCGKVWHSLVDREKQLKNNALCGVCGSFSTCGTGAGQAQYTRNIDTNIDTLNELKRCPQCGSNNYTEKVIYHEKQI